MPITHQEFGGAGFNSDHVVSSNFYEDNHVIQQTLIKHPKELIIDGLRHVFSTDSVFTYREDEYGFPLTPDATGGDFETNFSTKILISDAYRYDVKFFPAAIVKSNGGTYKPISFNQNGTIKRRLDIVEDAFGGRREVYTPTHRIYAGAWDLNMEISLFSDSHTELIELVDIAALSLQYTLFNELRAQGLLIKTLSVGAESSEQFVNDFIYSQNITLSCRSEWRVEIPLENLVEKIVFNIESTKTSSSPQKRASDQVELEFKDLIEITEI
jgi:hypothetical protein